MSFQRITRVSLLLAVFLLGALFIVRSQALKGESVLRENTMAALSLGGAANQNGDTLQPSESVDVVIETVSPVSVNLSDIPANVYDPTNQFDLWQKGQIDLEHEGYFGDAQLAAMQADAAKTAPEALPSSVGSRAPTLGASWAGMDYTNCCGGGGNVPPDVELAVGPSHVIEVVNVAFRIYNKTGTVLSGPTTFASFFSSVSGCNSGVFDPNVVYDESADRYVMAIDASNSGHTTSNYCVAVSQTNNPTGSWWLYKFNTLVSSRWMDYPHLGVGRTALYMGGNMFSAAGSFGEARVWAFNKSQMYSGAAASSVTRSAGTTEFTPQPLHLHGQAQGTWPTSGPHYFFTASNNFTGSNYSVFSWNDPFGVNTWALVKNNAISNSMPVNVVQSGTGGAISANDYRPLDFEYRNGYAWTTMTTACTAGGTTVDCPRFVQIQLSTGNVIQTGVYGSASTYRTFPDLAVNKCGDMGIGYTKSSSSMFPAVWFTGRLSGDAAGTLQAETQLKAGEITYTAFDSAPRRWGDYTEMTIAPDGKTFWYAGEYSKNTGTTSGRWGIYIGSMSYATCP